MNEAYHRKKSKKMLKNKPSCSKILFINRFFYPDYSATSQILSDLAFKLAASNNDVCVITSRLRYDDSSEQLQANEIVENVKTIRVWTSKFGRNSHLGRFIDYSTFYMTSAIMLWKHVDSKTIVVAKTDPPLISVIAAPIVRLRGGILVNWLQDIFPEVAFVLGVKVVRGPIYLVLKYLRNKALSAAEFNIVLGGVMAKYVNSLGIPKSKIRIMSNWADCGAVIPIEHKNNSLRKAWGLQDKFVIGYSGNLGRAHEFDTILRAVAALKQNKKIVFLFIGGGAQKETIQRAATKNGLDSIIFKGYQTREMLSQSLGCSDIHLVSLNPSLEGFIVPSKIYGILAAGRPTLFIGDTEGEVSQLLKKYNCGFSIASGEVEQLVDTILKYFEDASLREHHSENARNSSLSHFDKSLVIEKFHVIFDTVGKAAKTKSRNC